MAAPRVFISYSHDAEPHREAVLQLAQQLRAGGLDVQLDRFVTAPERGWPQWMMREVEAADHVLLVCTPTYRRRFEGQETPGKGKGVTLEGLLAIQHIYDANTRNNKFIPVRFEGGAEADIPQLLRPYTRYTLPDQLEPLYRHLTGQPEIVAAPLGPLKVMPPRGSTPAPTPTAPLAAPSTVHLAALTPAAVHSEGGRDVQLSPAELLFNLLLSLFSADQFRQWVSQGPDGPPLVAEFPGGTVSTSAAIFGGLDVLRRHGYLDAEFFARLAASFPRRRQAIAHVAATLGLPAPSAIAPATTHGGIHFHHDVSGHVTMRAGRDIIAGDSHTTTTVAPANQPLHTALDALRAALASPRLTEHKKISRACDDLAEELTRDAPDRSEVHDTLARALRLAARDTPDIATRPDVARPLAVLHAWTKT